MKAVVYHDVGEIRLEQVNDPKIEKEEDVIVRLTASAICGTDLHFVRDTILGHEGVGVVEEVGKHVRNLRKGDRVVIPSTVGCGNCNYCRAGYYAQCDVANPGGPQAGTTFFGGPESAGSLNGLQSDSAF